MSACGMCGDEQDPKRWLMFNLTLSSWPNGPQSGSDGGTYADLDICSGCAQTVEAFVRTYRTPAEAKPKAVRRPTP